MGCLSAAEVVDAVYTLVVIGGAKSVRNGVCGALASKSDGTETKGEGSVKIKQTLPAVTMKTVICRINGNSTTGTAEFDSRRSPSCKGNGPLAIMRLMKIGGTRKREVRKESLGIPLLTQVPAGKLRSKTTHRLDSSFGTVCGREVCRGGMGQRSHHMRVLSVERS